MSVLIKLALKNNKLTLATELALLAHIENNNKVYLDNAYNLLRDYMSPAQFAGHLSALTKQGRYIAHDQFFGEIVKNNT